MNKTTENNGTSSSASTKRFQNAIKFSKSFSLFRNLTNLMHLMYLCMQTTQSIFAPYNFTIYASMLKRNKKNI